MSEAYDFRGRSGLLREETADAIEACIAQLEREQRAPDHYECCWLVRAITWFSENKFTEATLDLGRAQKPLILRTRQDYVDIREHYHLLTTVELRRCWDDRKRR